jgi:hypothetical protein
VAYLALVAAHLGGGIVLDAVSPALQHILDLAGLRVKVEGKTELREEPLRLQEGQEEGHFGDLPP